MRATDARCCCQLLSMNINFHRAATHAFDKTLVNTVVQENANPIEKVWSCAVIALIIVVMITPVFIIMTAIFFRSSARPY